MTKTSSPKVSRLYTNTAAFGVILLLGIAHLSLIYALASKVVPAGIMQLIVALDSTASDEAWIRTPSEGLLVVLTFVLSAVAILMSGYALRALVRTLSTIMATKRYMAKLQGYFDSNNEVFVVTNRDNIAFTEGLLNPQIYISRNIILALTTEELNAVISHERAHQRAHDPLRSLLVNFVAALLPVVSSRSLIIEKYTLQSEVFADEFALDQVKQKRFLYSAMGKLCALEHSFNFNSFKSSASDFERLDILSGAAQLKLRSYFLVASTLVIAFAAGAILVNQQQLIKACEHLVMCLELVSSGSGRAHRQDGINL